MTQNDELHSLCWQMREVSNFVLDRMLPRQNGRYSTKGERDAVQYHELVQHADSVRREKLLVSESAVVKGLLWTFSRTRSIENGRKILHSKGVCSNQELKTLKVFIPVRGRCKLDLQQ
jgi:hypothetical protein